MPVPARHDVEVARRAQGQHAGSLAGPVEAQRCTQTQDMLDPVDDEIHPLAIDECDDAVHTGKS